MKRLQRSDCIRKLRDGLLEKAIDEEDTVCDVAARHGLFCRGFDRYPTPILRRKFPWLMHGEKGLDRGEVISRVRKWVNARQFVNDDESACDVMAREGDLCFGWNTFQNEKLEATYYELFGEQVEVVDDPRSASSKQKV